MSKIEEAVVKIKAEGVIEEAFLRTHADVVYTSDGKTLSAVIAEILTNIEAKANATDIDNRVNAIVNGAPEAYDTLKEVADYIAEHEEVYTALNEAIGNKLDKTVFDTKIKELQDSIGAIELNADNITETENRKFMTSAEKTKLQNLENYDDTEIKKEIAKKSRIFVSETEPADMTENDIWFQTITK